MSKRTFVTAIKALKQSTFDKTLRGNIEIKKKAWERASQDKDEWFRKKYAHLHAKSKPAVDKYGKREAYDNKIKQQYKDRKAEQKQHRSQYTKRHASSGLAVNPLMEYVYGTNSVTAALRGDKRAYYSRLLYSTGTLPAAVEQLATKKKIETAAVPKHDLNMLTRNGVHNGVVLETKPIEPIEIEKVGTVDSDAHTLMINNEILNYRIDREYPIGLYLDEITDPHNLGAIVRSAWFLGVDFIVMSGRNCSPLSPVVAKTSSGSIEYMPMYSVDKPLTFFTDSQNEGWTFVCSDVNNKYTKDKMVDVDSLNEISANGPVMLVIGSEGAGVRTNLKMRSDYFVNIPSCERGENNIDSLNASVATALLISKLCD